MKEKEKIQQLKQEYYNIDVPDELEFVIKKSFNSKEDKKGDGLIMFKRVGIVAMLAFGVFVGGINVSSTLANSLSEIPVLGSVVKVFTFRNFEVKEEGFEANIKVPNITGLENQALEDELNKKFIEEGQELYDEFTKEMEEIKSQGGEGHIAVETNYEVKTDNDYIFSVIISKLETMASSAVSYKTYTVDKINKSIVTLHSLFKNDAYIQTISDNIKEQMRQRMKDDENITYFIDQKDIPVEDFETIEAEQNFYINEDNKLVIVFDEYEVAPGYMGASEFVIPTDVIEDLLLDRGLIK